MDASAPTGILRAAEGDRPHLASLSPNWFRRHVVDRAWLAVSDRRIEAAAMLAPEGRTGTHLELAAVSDDATTRWLGPLLDTAIAEAEAMGIEHLDTTPRSEASTRHADRLLEAGFALHETFDHYEVELAAILEPTRALRDRMKGRVASRVRPDIVEIEARHLDPVAAAWAAWIGGNPTRSIDRMRRRFERSAVGSPIRRLQLVAVADDRVVGFACGNLASPTVLRIDAEAVAPAHRLDPFFMSLKTRFYENAAELGAERATFSAGRRQPDTRTLANRYGVEPARSRPRFRLDLPRRRPKPVTDA